MHHEQPMEHSMEHTSMHCGSLPEVWECLTEEQKKKGNYSAWVKQYQ